ncbi:Guanosine-diphosphatase [Podila minutissima]|uniref:guanosine-diphosphatase n=1 Tax=Podila minutissima TaxID=64525 RepID=A0A9P5VK02_9FUNG|nr:Guanosine-diphosphatase [Podila minutissima]
MTLVADERERNESSVSSSNRFSFISSKETTYSTQDSSSYSPHSSPPSPPHQPTLFQQGHRSSSSSSSPHVAFSADSGSSRPGSSDLADPHHHKGPSKLVKRNSLRLAKRISSSSLLPSNYSNKKKPFSEQDPTKRNVGGFYHSTIRPSVMLWKESIMARKGYWIRNVAILVFGLSLFFFVMLPRHQPNLHNRTTTDPFSKAINWPSDITSDHCTVAHPGRPLIQYVLMIDAGSSGSRIHAYKFNFCQATAELESEMFEHVEPGLSSYDDHPEDAAKSLDKLLDKAIDTIPPFLHDKTPVAVKATAGLRMMGHDKSEQVLAAVRHRMETKYPFPIIDTDGVVVMDGSEEGVYAWVTVNYLLERFSSLKKKSTVAILDLGGASTQIVFEPSTIGGHSVAQGPNRYPMNFNGYEYTLFQNSYLGYGLFEARRQINDYVVAHPVDSQGIALTEGQYAHPCMPVGHIQAFTTKDDRKVELVGISDKGTECRGVVEAVFYKKKACNQGPCSFNGQYQPSLNHYDDDIYAFSFIFDRVAPFRLGSNTLAQEMTLQELEDLTDRVCIGDENEFSEFATIAEAAKELSKTPEMCMDLSYIYALMEYGYGIPKDRKVKLAKKLKNYETGWCLGASIAVLEMRDWFNNA